MKTHCLRVVVGIFNASLLKRRLIFWLAIISVISAIHIHNNFVSLTKLQHRLHPTKQKQATSVQCTKRTISRNYSPTEVRYFYRAMPHSTESAVIMRQYVVCLCLSVYLVCPSVCDVQVPWSHRSEYFENSFTSEYSLTFDPKSQHVRSGATGHPKIRVEWGWGQEHKKPAISPRRCKLGPRLLWRTNRKSHTRVRLAPKSMNLDDHEVAWTAETSLLWKWKKFTVPARKTWTRTDSHYQRQNEGRRF